MTEQQLLIAAANKVTCDDYPLNAWPGGQPSTPWRWTCPRGHKGEHETQGARDRAVHEHSQACNARPVSLHTWRPQDLKDNA